MRVLIASDYFYPRLFGGGERQIYEIAKKLSKHYEIHVITRRLKGLRGYEKHGDIHIHRIFVPSDKTDPPSLIDTLLFMVGLFFKSLSLGDFDIYHAYQYSPVPPVWVSSRIKRKPIVTTVHNIYFGLWAQRYGIKGFLTGLLERVLLKLRYAKVLTVSNSIKKKLMEAGVPGEKVEVIYNGVDVKEFDRVKVEKPDKPRVIYLGRLAWYKHVDDLLISFSKLDFDAELYVAGQGPEQENLENLAKSLRIENKVHFIGFVDGERKIKILKSAHALVLPSTVEGLPLTLIEAMAARTPVISADIPVSRELVGEGETGLLFKPRDVDDLKAKLELVLKGKSLQTKLLKNAYELVKTKFVWDKVVARAEKVYKRLCAI